MYAILSGAFGATASCLAKVAFSSNTVITQTTLDWCSKSVGKTNNNDICEILVYIPRGICFVGTILLNIGMIGSFLEGMEQSGSVAGTAITTGSNFVISAIYGFIFWNEIFSFTWLIGFCMVIIGTILLSTVQAADSSASTTTTTTTTTTKSSEKDKKTD